MVDVPSRSHVFHLPGPGDMTVLLLIGMREGPCMASQDIYGLGGQPSLNLQAQSHLHPSSYGTRFLRHQSPVTYATC